MIPENMKNLIENYKLISKSGWIKSIDKGEGSVGLTFERSIDKSPDSLFFPDYNGIEIKCSTRYSRFPVSLFSLAFEGPTYPEINRIVDLYGYPDYKYKDKKVLKVDVKCNSIKKCGNYKFSLSVDEKENKIYLEVYDLNEKLIEKKSYMYIDTFLNHLNLKLNYFALIKASKKNIEGNTFYRYYHIIGYKLRNNDIVLKLLKEGIIFATLESRVGKSGLNSGIYKNKNLVFKIEKKDLNKLFSILCEVDSDFGYDRLNSHSNGFFIMR